MKQCSHLEFWNHQTKDSLQFIRRMDSLIWHGHGVMESSIAKFPSLSSNSSWRFQHIKTYLESLCNIEWGHIIDAVYCHHTARLSSEFWKIVLIGWLQYDIRPKGDASAPCVGLLLHMLLNSHCITQEETLSVSPSCLRSLQFYPCFKAHTVTVWPELVPSVIAPSCARPPLLSFYHMSRQLLNHVL